MSDDDDTKRAKELSGNVLAHVDALVAIDMSKAFFMQMVSDYWGKCEEVQRFKMAKDAMPRARHLRVVK